MFPRKHRSNWVLYKQPGAVQELIHVPQVALAHVGHAPLALFATLILLALVQKEQLVGSPEEQERKGEWKQQLAVVVQDSGGPHHIAACNSNPIQALPACKLPLSPLFSKSKPLTWCLHSNSLVCLTLFSSHAHPNPLRTQCPKSHSQQRVAPKPLCLLFCHMDAPLFPGLLETGDSIWEGDQAVKLLVNSTCKIFRVHLKWNISRGQSCLKVKGRIESEDK